jgi:cell division transport system permease protein
MTRLRLVVAEALRSISANFSTTVAATLTVLIAMFLVGLLVGFFTYARSWSDQKKGELLVKVFFCTDLTCPKEGRASGAQINAVRAKLEASPLVREVRFVGKDDALDRMRKRHPELDLGLLPSNPLPDAEEVIPVRGEYVDEIARSLENPHPPGVETIDYGQKTAEKILEVARLIEFIFLAAIVILLVAATVLIANTIRLSIFARRREIEVMKLVGASNWFVRGPFMLEGLICGLIGSVCAIVLLVAGREFALPAIRWPDDPGVNALAFPVTALIVVGIGLLLGAAGSALTIRRFLRV